MQYRPYGKTGKKLSVISAGGMRYSDPDRTDEMAQVPLEAARLGVNYFDTAPGYSNNQSETILGRALKEMKKEGLEHYVSTKTWGGTYDLVMEHVENSLKNMDTDHIDFYNSWGVNARSVYADREKGGAFKALRQLKDDGTISHIVCSSHMQGDELAWLVEQDFFEGFTFGFCAINFPYRLTGIEAAETAGYGVITMNPLGGGEIITHPDRFDFIRTRPEQTLLEAALHFNLAHSGITSALVGFRSVEDVRSAVQAGDTYMPITDKEMAKVKTHIEDSFDSLCTTCNYCRECPNDIPVARFMEAYNYMMLYNEPRKIFERLKWHWGRDNIDELDKCDQCLVCEEACTQKLPIMERFDKIREYFKDKKNRLE